MLPGIILRDGTYSDRFKTCIPTEISKKALNSVNASPSIKAAVRIFGK